VVASVASGHTVDTLRGALCGEADVPRFGYRTLFVPVAPNPIRYLQRLAHRARFGELQVHHLLELDGLLTTAGVEKYFRRNALCTNRFSDLAVGLYIAATQVNGARKVVFGPTDSLGEDGYDDDCAYYNNIPISQAVAAAVSIPPVFAPYAITNPATGKRFHYYDGEVRETLSVHVARDAGADFVIASSIWCPYQYDERIGTIADLGMITLAEQALHQAVGQKVDRDRGQGDLFARVLEVIEEHGRAHALPREATLALQAEVCRVLQHRPVPTLYVTPLASDHDFFFASSFRFGRALVDRCIDAGRRAYHAAARGQPEFLVRLDSALEATRRP
jgi:predicted acylesterase/phospholipase RssA